jgi:release factor glutamine methyltransferase
VAFSPLNSREDARRAAITRLRQAGIETAVLDADLLLGHVLGLRKEDLYAHPEAALPARELERYDALVARRARGEPVAYLRGVKEFYGLEFTADPRALIPRPESELLVEHVVQRLHAQVAPLVCDLGTGSGAMAIALAIALPRAQLIATDASADAIALALDNAARHRVAERIAFRVGDLLTPVHEPLDAVVANLPYLTTAEVDAGRGTSIEFEPRAALDGGADGLDVIRRAIGGLAPHLGADAIVAFECAPQQAAAVAGLIESALGQRAGIVRDLAGAARFVRWPA